MAFHGICAWPWPGLASSFGLFCLNKCGLNLDTNIQEVFDKASKDVAKVKEAAAEKMEKIIQDTSEEVTELKAAADAKLQGMFKQKEEAPAELE